MLSGAPVHLEVPNNVRNKDTLITDQDAFIGSTVYFVLSGVSP